MGSASSQVLTFEGVELLSFCHEKAAEAVDGYAVGVDWPDVAGWGSGAQKPKRVIADRGYDSDALRERWKRRCIELIAPCPKNNKERKYEDGRILRRYKRRWKIECTNAWLGQFRRVLVRHEHPLTVYRAFFHLAFLWITLQKYF